MKKVVVIEELPSGENVRKAVRGLEQTDDPGMIAADWQDPSFPFSRKLGMKKMIPLTLCATLVASVCLTGCIGQQTIHGRGLAPTEDEAKQIAKSHLDEEAGSRRVMTNISYKTKALPQENGGFVYEVTATQRVK